MNSVKDMTKRFEDANPDLMTEVREETEEVEPAAGEERFHHYRNRTMCEVLDEMRAMFKTLSFGGMAGLIEEIQAMGNRMESALNDQKDLDRARQSLKTLLVKYDKLYEEVTSLEEKKADLKKDTKILAKKKKVGFRT
tara:strand:- start:723 stop:1136 length:414 start_codon:yes stop_codon:yes gene_type:complete